MNLITIAAGLSTLLDSMSGLAGSGPDGGDAVFAADGTQAILTFRLTSAAGLGLDETRTEYDPDAVIAGDTSGPGGTPATGGVIYSVGGPRVLTYTIKIECGDQITTAATYLERIRTRCCLPSTTAALSALGLGFAKFTRLADYAGESFANRELSVAIGELVLNAVDTASDAPVTTIQTLYGTADVPFTVG